MIFLHQITVSSDVVLILFLFSPLIRPYSSSGGLGHLQLKFIQTFTKSSGTVGTLRALSCSLLFFPYGKFTASAEHHVSFKAPEWCLASKIAYKIESRQLIFLCLQAPTHWIAQPPIWKSGFTYRYCPCSSPLMNSGPNRQRKPEEYFNLKLRSRVKEYCSWAEPTCQRFFTA